MDHNFYRLYMPRLRSSLIAAYLRTPMGRKWGRERVEEDISKFIAEFKAMAELVRDKERMDVMRSAASNLALALDPCVCFVAHCESNHFSHAMNCRDTKNPKRCPKLLAYVEKKAVTPECGDCQYISGAWYRSEWALPHGRCTCGRNEWRPKHCPKREATSCPKT